LTPERMSLAWPRHGAPVWRPSRIKSAWPLSLASRWPCSSTAEWVSTESRTREHCASRAGARPPRPAGPIGADWSSPVFRYTSKVGRQVLRFFLSTVFTNRPRRRFMRPSGGHRCWHIYEATGHRCVDKLFGDTSRRHQSAAYCSGRAV